MSFDPIDRADDADALLARAGDADAHARALRAATARDLLVPDAARLDDRRRAAARHALYRTVEHYADAILRSADIAIAIAIDRNRLHAEVERRLGDDLPVANDLIDRVTLDLLNEALPEGLVEPSTWPAGQSRADATLARLEAAERRRRDLDAFTPDLPAESQARFIWWIAAAIAVTSDVADRAVLDRSLAKAARVVLAEQDEGERLEAWAMRLAGQAGELPPLIDHCLGERRLALLVAVIARRLHLEYDVVRAMIVDADDARLWVALRALELPRKSVARIGFALGEADPRRDVEAFADRLDVIMSIEPAAAHEALSPLRLPPAYRSALAEGAAR